MEPSPSELSPTSRPGAEPTRAATAALTWADGGLLRHGEPHRVLSGSLHYFRVVPELWRDRLTRLRDLGLNTVDTYLPWNFHQPDEGAEPDFTGWRDIRAFVATAQEVGLDVIVRPGPYICAEWTNGGLPSWLTARGLPLRTSDPAFLEATAAWFDAVLPQLHDLQAAFGGPIVAVQVENEFGSYGDDPAYIPAIARMLRERGVEELLYTADGPTELMLDAGTAPDLLSALTFGSKPEQARALQTHRRPDEPFFCAEFWNGWFDHWGQLHHVRDASDAADVVSRIVTDRGNVSIYMAHGGTNFGLWAGANHVDGELRATTTSYDSDAPIAEDGTLTEKFFAIREALGMTEPLRSQQPEFVKPFTVELHAGRTLLPALDAVAQASVLVGPTCTFEELGMDAGLLRLEATVLLPGIDVPLNLPDVGDRATVFLGGRPLGTVQGGGSVVLPGSGRPELLTVLIESLGRVNYGPGLGERKGLRTPALIERRMIQHWTATPLPVDRWDTAVLDRLAATAAGSPAAGPIGAAPVAADAGVLTASFELDAPADAHLALPGSGKGFAWLNGFLLGRYWSIGPQQTLYVPAPRLRAGRNELLLLELENRGGAAHFGARPELGPTEQYIEEF